MSSTLAAQPISAPTAVTLACPACRTPLLVDAGRSTCSACDSSYPREDGIWRLLAPGRAERYAQFTREYQTVRRAERWGGEDPAYYRALPWQDLSGRHGKLWRIRAAGFRTFVDEVLEPLERERGRPLLALDLGAGNGWLAYRLAQRGHVAFAVDLATDAYDGLGAAVHFDAAFMTAQAEFDRLPLADAQADLVVFNASLHYSTDYLATLGEALRVLRADGSVVVLDSPLYHDQTSGARMVGEREARFRQAYGFASDALPSEHYLTPARLDEVGRALGIHWRFLAPAYGWRWAARPWIGRVRARREPATFCVIVGEQASEAV